MKGASIDLAFPPHRCTMEGCIREETARVPKSSGRDSGQSWVQRVSVIGSAEEVVDRVVSHQCGVKQRQDYLR